MYRTVLMHRGDITCWHAQSWRFLLSSSVCPHNKVKTWKQVQTRLLLWRSLSSENWTQPTSWNDWCSCERLVLCFDCNVAHDHTILRDLQFSLSSSWTSFSFNRDMQMPSPPPVSSWLGYRYWTDFIRAVMAADILKCSTGRVLMLKDCLIFGRYLCHRAKYTSRSVVLTTCVRSRIKNNSRPRMTDRSVYIMTSSSQMETILVIYNLKSFKWFIFVCWTTIMNLYDLYKSIRDVRY